VEGFISGVQGAAVTDPSPFVALGGWLGAILARLRAGEPPLPGSVSDDRAIRDAEQFGAQPVYQVQQWHHKLDRIPQIDTYLREIHALARNQPWEQAFWQEVLAIFIPTPLEPSLAKDLLDRGIGRGWMAHSWQEEAVWWRLVDEFPEAVHNLALWRYTNPGDDWSRVEEIFNQFPWWSELARLLAEEEPSTRAKAAGLARLIRAQNIVGDVEQCRRRWNQRFVEAWEEVPVR
jgi:hypothetical protein